MNKIANQLAVVVLAGLALRFSWPVEAGAKGKRVSYQAIDRHAVGAPREAEKTSAALAAYLVKPAKTEAEKVRALFRWLTDRIVFNAADFLAGKAVPNDPETVLKSRSAICEGYANLFVDLCKEAGLEAVKIYGFSRGYGPVPREGKLVPNHAWNAVKVDGQWRLLDVTWGAGSVDRKKGFWKRFEEYYFFPDPEGFIFHHFPNEERWQLLENAVPARTFQAWPEIDLQLFKWGARPKDLQQVIADKDFRGTVKTFDPKGARVRLLQVPLYKHLQAGQTYRFRIEAPSCLEMVYLQDGRYRTLGRKVAGIFDNQTSFRQGTLKVRGRFYGKGNIYWSILEYEVGD